MNVVPPSPFAATPIASFAANSGFASRDVMAEGVIPDPDHDLVAETGQPGRGGLFGATEELARNEANSTPRAAGDSP